jgi:hypothetical protein
MTEPIYAATAWATNAAMIADVHQLGYIKDGDFVLDPTYGKGAWWRVWGPEPEDLIRKDRAGDPEWDFRDMHFLGETFDAVAFDPPYVSVGGRKSSGIHEMHEAYGMDGTPLSPGETQSDIDQGLAECFRVVKKGGIVLVKCQDYVSSGQLWPGTYLTLKNAYEVGFQLVDRLEHLSGPRPQPPGRAQVHARRNYSTLFVLRRPKR